MRTLEESIAFAMDSAQNTAIIPFLPYIFQDFWELGTPSELVINLVQKHCDLQNTLSVLDLGCGKGSVSIKLAKKLNCKCLGIDGIPEFIESSKEKAREYGVDALCRFEVGDVREKIVDPGKFDIIILGATGPIFDDYYTALTTLSKHLTNKGIIIIGEAYINDESAFQHPSILPRKELLKEFEQAEMELIDETIGKYNTFSDIAKEMEFITLRCDELKNKFPKKSSIFENFIQNQATEYDVLENKIDEGSIMVLKSKYHDFQISDTIIHCKISGSNEKPALVFLHGNGENLQIFDKQIRYFSQYYRTIAIDTRAHGKSARGTKPLNFYTFSSDLFYLLDFLKIDKANIVGFSDGAITALHLALKCPNRISSMVLLGVNYNPKGIKLLTQLFLLFVYACLSIVSPFSKKLQRRKEIWGLMIAQPNLQISDLEQITVKTLVVTGEKDMIRKRHNDEICNAIKGSQRIEIKGGNHFWWFKKTELLNQIVMDFLK